MSQALVSPAHRAARLAEQAILGVIAAAAASIGVASVVFLALRIAEIATGPETTLSNAMLVDPLTAGFASPAVVSSSVDLVSVTIANTPDSVRAWLIGADMARSLSAIGACAIVAWLCVRLLVGKPFVRSVTWGIGVVAMLMFVSGTFGPLLDGIANAQAAIALDLTELDPFVVVFDPATVGWAFVLTIVAGAFEVGRRLQRDSEGLV